MLQWIAKLLSTEGTSPPCVHTIAGGGLEVRVYEYAKHCGHQGYALELFAHSPERAALVGLAFVGAEDLQRSIMLLQEAMEFVNDRAAMPRQLQTVWVWGATYYVDERLGELRRKDDPSDRVPLVRE